MRTLLALGATLAATPALAQDAGIDAHGFYPGAQDGDVRDPLEGFRPGRMRAGEFYAGGIFEIADSLLRYVSERSDGADRTVETALSGLVALNLGAGYTVHDRVRIDVAMPVFFTSTGTDGSQGGGIGDLRLGGTVSILRPDPDGGFGLGASPYIVLPIGADAKNLGAPGLAGGGTVGATYELGDLTVGADVGMQFNKAVEIANLNGSDALLWGLAAGYRLVENHGVSTELRAESALSSNEIGGTGSPMEWALSYRGRVDSGLHWTAGFSTALTRAAGAAKWRIFLGVGYGLIKSDGPEDRDKDGIYDDKDDCPDVPEVVNGYKDEDG